jgi:ankyrin repeat protein
MYGHLDIVNALIKANADLKIKDMNGNTALHTGILLINDK